MSDAVHRAQDIGRHAHITGRPRDYISRKWFYRGIHRLNAHRPSVDELTANLNRQLAEANPTGWYVSADGKSLICNNVTLRFPPDFDTPQQGFLIIEPQGGLTSIPALNSETPPE